MLTLSSLLKLFQYLVFSIEAAFMRETAASEVLLNDLGFRGCREFYFEGDLCILHELKALKIK